MTLYYISFADDTHFLGGTVVDAKSVENAIYEATNRNLNPGGEAVVLEVPKDMIEEPSISVLINRLASEEELISRGGIRHVEMNEKEMTFISNASVVKVLQ